MTSGVFQEPGLLSESLYAKTDSLLLELLMLKLSSLCKKDGYITKSEFLTFLRFCYPNTKEDFMPFLEDEYPEHISMEEIENSFKRLIEDESRYPKTSSDSSYYIIYEENNMTRDKPLPQYFKAQKVHRNYLTNFIMLFALDGTFKITEGIEKTHRAAVEAAIKNKVQKPFRLPLHNSHDEIHHKRIIHYTI